MGSRRVLFQWLWFVLLDRPNTITTLVNLATCLPTMEAFVHDNDADVIYVGHSLIVYPRNTQSTPATVMGVEEAVAMTILMEERCPLKSV